MPQTVCLCHVVAGQIQTLREIHACDVESIIVDFKPKTQVSWYAAKDTFSLNTLIKF